MKRLLGLGFLLSVLFVSAAFGDVIVRMKAPEAVPGTVSTAGAESARTMAATMTAAGAGGMVVKVYENLVLDGEVLALMRPAGDEKAFAEALAKDANVGGVAFDRPIYGTGAEITAKGANNFNTEMIDAPLAGVDVSGQVVYVLDSGIDSQGPLGHLIDYSLSRAYLDEPGDAGMPEWQDYNGHGTFVSSVAVADGKLDVVGVAPGARVAAMKVLGVNKKGSTEFIVDALNDIAGHQFEGVRAINMSLGYFFPNTPEEIAAGRMAGGGYDPVYFALEAMDKQDRFVFVTSAGNENFPVGKPVERGGDDWDAGEYVYPGSYIGLKGLLTVGSVNKDGSASDFSNYSGEFVHFQAPGKGIVGYGSGTSRGGFDELVLFGKGTSMSSPHIAGMVAALSAKDPGLGAAAIIEKMARSTKAAPAMKSNGEPLSKYGTPSLAKAAGIDPAGPGNPDAPDAPDPGVPGTPDVEPPADPFPLPGPNPNLPWNPDPTPPSAPIEGEGGSGCDAGLGWGCAALGAALTMRRRWGRS